MTQTSNSSVMAPSRGGLSNIRPWSLRLCVLSLPLLWAIPIGSGWSIEAEQSVNSSAPTKNLLPPEMAAANPMVGQTVAINGSVLPIPWRQTDGRIAIADFALSDHLGATLLNTNNPEVQPVQWHAAPDQQPVNLAAQTDSGYRFLDITTLANQQGWVLTPQGSTLYITTPIHQIQAIQRETHAQGERLVLYLTGDALPFLTEGVGNFSLTLAATVDEAVISSLLPASSDSLLQSLTITPTAERTELTAQIASTARPIISTLSNPSRIIVDVREDFLQPKDIAWAAGVRWRQQYVVLGAKRFPVYWLQVDPRQANLTLRPIWSDPTTATGITPLQTMAQRWQAAAAINAGFFNRNNQYPLGAVRYDGQWISGPILSRGVVAWNQAGQVAMNRLFLRQALTTDRGQSFSIQATNSGYVQAGIGLYTSTWGPDYRPITGNEIIVTVVDGRVVDQQVVTAGEGSIPIPLNGGLLVLRSFATAAPALLPGTSISIQSELIPTDLQTFPNIIGGGPLLLQNRQLVLNAELEQFSSAFATQAAPRSAIGLNSAGELLLVAVHNSPAGSGPTLQELAQIMAQLGSTDALNLDGGSSASLYLGGRLLNRNPRTAARVNNGIGLFLE